MRCRDLQPEDLPRLKEMFSRQGFDYEFPDVESAQFLVKRVVVDDDGTVVSAVAARQTVEIYLLADPTYSTPRWRLEALELIHEDVRQQLESRGIYDAHFWAPPNVCRGFIRRMMKVFGWRKQIWQSYCRIVSERTA